ncbi:MAG: SUMF1/EgtB/PvdO family nonheme iron enzyme [Candidatus Hatepunaea meridiana]|nr:SUMF1/EgtB/PvdO family nonheme iron enzyme [Candidatus Hatepunaea meridiana]
MRLIKFFTVLIFLSILIGCNDNDNPITIDNNPPVIIGVKSGISTIRPDAVTTVICYATDPDNDELSYKWLADAGVFPNGSNQSSVKWLAPITTGDYVLSVRVDDGNEYRQSSISVQVSLNGDVGETEIEIANFHLTETMIWISPGSFQMGAERDSLEYADTDEYPRHNIIIENGFWIGKYEVSQMLWEAVTDTNPSVKRGLNNPVDNVSWEDVHVFIDTLNSYEEGSPWRLPSEAEWEYVCRSGNDSTLFPWGNDTLYTELERWAIYGYYSGVGSHTEVGCRLPNAWGIHDMIGNVWEWCEDKYHRNYNNAPDDGSVWSSGRTSMRMLRGGSWYDIPQNCRSSSRHSAKKDLRYRTVGFRLVRSLPWVTLE